MNDTASTHASADSAKRTCGALLETITDIGTSWAAYGLKIGKMALEQSAHTLGKTAHALDVIATELEKKAATVAPAGDKPAEAPQHDGVAQEAPPAA